jgi:DNA-binding LytR/AlgR family response regulator
MRRSLRFWLAYSIAWLPFVASYLLLLLAHLRRPSSEAIRATIFATLPPILLGLGVIAICNRFRWRSERRVGFFAAHFLLAGIYVLLWMAGSKSLAKLDQKIEYRAASNLRISETSFEVSIITGFLIYAAIAGVIYGIQSADKLRAKEARMAELENLQARVDSESLSTNNRSDQCLTRLFVKNSRGEIVPVRVADVVRFVGADDYVEIFANSAAFLVRLTLSELEKRLDPEHFRRIHRSAIVNLDHLVSCREVDRRLVLKLSDGSEVTASHSGSQSLRELIV